MAQQRPQRKQAPKPPQNDEILDQPGVPDAQVPEAQVAHPDQPEPEPLEEDEVTTTADLMLTPREVEVEPVRDAPQPPDAEGMVVIRMSETIEDFTYGNPYMHAKLEAGRQYRMPRHIASYLDGLGYVYH